MNFAANAPATNSSKVPKVTRDKSRHNVSIEMSDDQSERINSKQATKRRRRQINDTSSNSERDDDEVGDAIAT